jgi:hypothetical protein
MSVPALQWSACSRGSFAADCRSSLGEESGTALTSLRSPCFSGPAALYIVSSSSTFCLCLKQYALFRLFSQPHPFPFLSLLILILPCRIRIFRKHEKICDSRNFQPLAQYFFSLNTTVHSTTTKIRRKS